MRPLISFLGSLGLHSVVVGCGPPVYTPPMGDKGPLPAGGTAAGDDPAGRLRKCLDGNRYALQFGDGKGCSPVYPATGGLAIDPAYRMAVAFTRGPASYFRVDGALQLDCGITQAQITQESVDLVQGGKPMPETHVTVDIYPPSGGRQDCMPDTAAEPASVRLRSPLRADLAVNQSVPVYELGGTAAPVTARLVWKPVR